ncbi:MAG TPA: BON domain-containing protein, partial [Gammaproteobacteria bacterium]|nr:BON domain-containing protein [Gammaproteobacteria bacterium]
NEVDANELHVLGNQELLTDLVITAKIKGLLSQHQVFGDQDLSMVDLTIETHHGVVYLSGTLENQVEIQNVITLAGSVKGVKEVRVNLKLSAREPRPSSSLARANQ